MKTSSKNPHQLAVVQQVANNTTSWIGFRPRDNEHVVTGQTFISPTEADLESIEVFSAIITKAGHVTMTLHSFDRQENCWGPALGSVTLNIHKEEAGKWLAFCMPGLHLDKGKAYGFRLESPDTYLGVGEAVGSHMKPPFGAGQEWQFTDKHQDGRCFSYFSLAFKVEVRA